MKKLMQFEQNNVVEGTTLVVVGDFKDTPKERFSLEYYEEKPLEDVETSMIK